MADHTRISTILFLCFVLLVIVACEGQPGAEGDAGVKTLEDFATGESIGGANVCRGSHAVEIEESRIHVDTSSSAFRGQNGVTNSRAAKAAVQSYLTALPSEVQRAFVAFDGRIVVTDKASQWCRTGTADPDSYHYVAGERDVRGCFLFLSYPGDNRGHVFTIVHAPNLESIRHEGVRLFGFLYAQFFPRLRQVSAADEARYQLHVQENAKLYTLKRTLANAFLRDAAGLRTGLAPLEPMLGIGAAKRLQMQISSVSADTDLLAKEPFRYANDPSPWKQQTTASKIRLQRFQDYVFAEAFDSFYCNVETRQTMTQAFSRTDKAFNPLQKAVIAMARHLAGNDANSSLALTNPFLDMGDFFPTPSMSNPYGSGIWGEPGTNNGYYEVNNGYTPFYETNMFATMNPDSYNGFLGGSVFVTQPDTLMSQATQSAQDFPIPTGYDPAIVSDVNSSVPDAGTGSLVTLGEPNTVLGLTRYAH